MLRTSMCPALLLAASLLLTALPTAAESADPAYLINAFQVDIDGNFVEGFDLEIDDKAVVIGDPLYDGQVLTNRGRMATVMTLSTGDTLTLDASLSKRIALDSQERKCRCECRGKTFSYPPTTQDKCKALNNQECEHPAGTVGILRSCGMRWVTVTRLTLKALNASSAAALDP